MTKPYGYQVHQDATYSHDWYLFSVVQIIAYLQIAQGCRALGVSVGAMTSSLAKAVP